jgi:hypothetical protein
MLGALLGLGEALGTRFRVLGMLPSVLLVGFVLAVLEGGAPSDPPDLNEIAAAVEGLGAWEGVLLLLAVMALALLSEPLQLSLVRLLEGYWGGSAVAGLVARPLIALQKRGRCREQKLELMAEGSVSTSRRELAAWRLRTLYPSASAELLPTRLGNVLRSAEGRAGGRYGLGSVVVWPRLYPLLPERLTGILDDQRGQLDVAARFCAVFLVAAAVSAALLVQHGWWLAVPLVALMLAVLSYRGAISAAIAYGVTLEAAFDLHRFDLLAALHLPLPPDRTTERSANKELSDFLRQGVPVNFGYTHAMQEKREYEAEAKESQPARLADAQR